MGPQMKTLLALLLLSGCAQKEPNHQKQWHEHGLEECAHQTAIDANTLNVPVDAFANSERQCIADWDAKMPSYYR
jgi:outer membrane biogenesis lipoprotein LolB